MAAEGLSIILITHKLDEVTAVSDRVTVFRQGRRVATLTTAETTKAELARLMVGREVIFQVQKEPAALGQPVLEVQDLTALRPNRREALRGVSFQVRGGEIMGLAGVAGNGQKELFDILVGVGTATGGSARVLILGLQREQPFRSGPLTNVREIAQFAWKAIKEYAIASAGPQQRIGVLSGGNMQKVILARELSRPLQCVIASSPTRGLDVGATEFVHRRLLAMRQAGAGILLISEDLDEILTLADRIAVLFQGRIMGTFAAAEAQRESIGLLMCGVQEEAA
jgi:simple sugar transport system ATP-binding protein